MKIKSRVRAGGLTTINRSEKALKVRTKVRAGGVVSQNRSETVRR